MPVGELGELFLVCCDSDYYLLPETIRTLASTLIRKVHFVDVSGHAARGCEPALETLPVERYLDRYYLWQCTNRSNRQVVMDALFDTIASRYDLLIDANRNRDNISRLLGQLRGFGVINDRKVIVDYGCGTGLAAPLANEMGVRLVGVERCPSMRLIASGRGMQVWSPTELACQPPNSIAGAFASYVFHLLSKGSGLRLLLSRVSAGGVIVGNFHKGKGVKLITDCLTKAGCKVLMLEAPDSSYEHGDYVAYIKV